jgi:hypothetical protein
LWHGRIGAGRNDQDQCEAGGTDQVGEHEVAGVMLCEVACEGRHIAMAMTSGLRP